MCKGCWKRHKRVKTKIASKKCAIKWDWIHNAHAKDDWTRGDNSVRSFDPEQFILHAITDDQNTITNDFDRTLTDTNFLSRYSVVFVFIFFLFVSRIKWIFLCSVNDLPTILVTPQKQFPINRSMISNIFVWFFTRCTQF